MHTITYGGIITSFAVPDRNGMFDDVVLGFDDAGAVLRNPPYFGAIIGRYANRIARARFTLDGRDVQAGGEQRSNHLHGGVKGFDKVVWKASRSNDDAVGHVHHVSPDGEEGYPGTLRVKRDLHADQRGTNSSSITRPRPTRRRR